MLRVLGHIVPREGVVVAAGEMFFGGISIYLALWVTASAAASPKFAPLSPLSIVFGLIVCFAATAAILGLYRTKAIAERYSLAAKGLLAGLLGLLTIAVLPQLLHPGIQITSGTNQLAALAVPLAWLACLAATQAAVSVAIQHRLLARRILIVAPPGQVARFESFVASGGCRRFEEIRLVEADHDGSGVCLTPEALRRERIWAVVVATGNGSSVPASALLDLRLSGIRVLSEAAFWEHEGCWIDVDSADVSWVLDREGFRHGHLAEVAKRLFDLVLAAVLVVLAAPLMAVVAILIKWESPGPALYRQQRVGLHGRPFTLYKFRSMRADAEAGGVPQWATIADPRVTQVGRFIRSSRIDELPQLFNVLRGEMSIVGPRPERPYFVDDLVNRIPFYAQRHCVKPGITGWAQVNAPYGGSIEEAHDKLRYDLYYVKNRGLLLDCWIVVCTVRVVLFREGAR